MRILVISDIHANLTALDTVIKAAGAIDAAWCLGDLVGYGPDPNEVVERIRRLPNVICLMGNHDAAALDRIDIRSFNADARKAIEWTKTQLTTASTDYLASLAEKIVVGDVTLSHGSPRHPVWEYLLDSRTATNNFEYFDTPYCFVGHTHLPVIYDLDGAGSLAHLDIPEANTIIKLTWRTIINPGSVGQPRDRDPRAAFAIFDSEQATWHYQRIDYNFQAVQQRMEHAGLPDKHIQRLAIGW